MWEVDPETRSKLQQIQKKDGSGNDRCCDCGAPSPQWASPKFSTFICLSCAGVHRGLGVHISFVRSISMDAFKQNEILRMQHGGNKAWQTFYDANIGAENGGKRFKDSSIKERYESDVGDEWKENLSADVEEKTFDREAWKKGREAYHAKIAARAGATPTSTTTSQANSRSQTPQPTKPSAGQQQPSKQRNETYFATLGATNASRPSDLPPSEGGRYAGFGSSQPAPSPSSQNSAPTTTLPSTQEFSTDPVAALSKSLGWFTTSVARTAKTVNDAYIQPTAKNIAASDIAAQARAAATQAGTGIQSGARGVGESFNRFVEGGPGPGQGSQGGATGGRGGGGGTVVEEPEKKDFWDSFGEPAKPQKSESSIGTAAMKTKATGEGGGAGAGGGGGVGSASGGGGRKGDDGWDKW